MDGDPCPKYNPFLHILCKQKKFTKVMPTTSKAGYGVPNTSFVTNNISSKLNRPVLSNWSNASKKLIGPTYSDQTRKVRHRS